MSDGLRDFVIGVASDSDLGVRFAADPGAELDRAGLTDQERSALLSRDSARLREALGAARKGAANVVEKKKKPLPAKKKKKGKGGGRAK